MNSRALPGRVASFLLLAVAVSSALGQASMARDLSEFRKGRIGALGIGMASSQLEQRLGRVVTPEFAGDGRAGVSFDQQSDLQPLGVLMLLGVRIQAVDIFFKEQGNALVVDLVSLSIACSQLPRLQSQLSSQGKTFTGVPGSSSSMPSKSGYAWGVEAKPSCRVWLREA